MQAAKTNRFPAVLKGITAAFLDAWKNDKELSPLALLGLEIAFAALCACAVLLAY